MKEQKEKLTSETCFLFHKWSKWELIGEGTINWQGNKPDNAHLAFPIGKFIEQQRTCKRCGMTQLRRERTETPQ